MNPSEQYPPPGKAPAKPKTGFYPPEPKAEFSPPKLPPLSYATPPASSTHQMPDMPWPLPPGSITRNRAVLRFFAGFALGTGVSGLVWIVGWNTFMGQGARGYVIFVVPGVKLMAGTTLLFFRNWRTFASGILVSIALGFLIFFGSCAHFVLSK